MPAVIFKESQTDFVILDPYYGGLWEFGRAEIEKFLRINHFMLSNDVNKNPNVLDNFLKSDDLAAQVYDFIISERIPKLPHYFPKAVLENLEVLDNGIITPPEIILEVSRKCNYSCPWCYISDMTNNEDELSVHDLTEHLIKPMIAIGARRWTLSGGEPSVTKDKTIRIAEIITRETELKWKLKPEIEILTNGYNFSKYADMYFKSNIKTVQFNLSSPYESEDNRLRRPKKGINSYTEVINGVKKAKEIGFQTSINMVVAPDNKDSVSDIIKLAYDLDVNWLRMTPVVISGKAKENGIFLDFESYVQIADTIASLTQGELAAAKGVNVYFPSIELEKDRPMWCGLGFLDYYVGYNGLVYPCNNLIENELICDDESIRTTSATGIWFNSLRLKDFRNYRINNIGEECGSCKSRSYCVGNCIARCWQQYGQFNLLQKPVNCLLEYRGG